MNNYNPKKIIGVVLLIVLTLLFSLNSVYSDTNSTNTSDNSTNTTINTTIIIDFDSDGYNFSIDCDDTNPYIYPNASEIPYDGIDQDCDGLDLIDVDKDGFDYLNDCDDTNAQVNPNMTESFYNGLDDDCNTATTDEILFEITTSKSVYSIGEGASFTINAHNHSDVSITLEVPQDYFNYQAQFVEQTYPITENIPSTKRYGQYTIRGVLNYQSHTLAYNKTFTVANSITIDLDGDRKINDGETFALEADGSGGYGDYYIYNWYFGDGATATGKSATHKYATPGSYDLRVSATDVEGNAKNQIFELRVYRLYSLKIIVKDKTTNSPVSDVIISIGDDSIKTGSDGAAYFTGRKGDYDFFAYKTGYKDYEAKGYDLDNNQTLTITMQRIDNNPPKITIQNNELVSYEGIAYLNFSVEDESKTKCLVYTSTDSDWWNLETEIEDITNSEIQKVKLTGLPEESIKFKVECVDIEENTALSEEGSISPTFKITTSLSGTKDVKVLQEELGQANNLIENLGSKEKEVYSILELDTLLKDADRKSSNLERDIDNIKNPRCPGIHCNITNEERQKRVDDAIQKTVEAIENTANKVEVVGYQEYVKYPTKLEIEAALKNYFETKNKALTKNQLKKLVEQNSVLQSKITVSTKVYNVHIVYISGKSKEVTLLKKEIELYDRDGSLSKSKTHALIEDIPRDLSRKTKIEFISDAQLISENVYGLPITKKEVIYYSNSLLSNEEAKSPNTLLLSTQLEKSSITGMSILNIDFKDVNYFYLLTFLLLTIVILRVALMFGLFDRLGISKLFAKFKEKEFHQMNMLINDALDYMEGGDLQKSSLIYREIKLKYEELSRLTKEKIYDKIVELCEKLDEDYMKNLIETAKQDMDSNNKSHAIKVYDAISKTYTKLAENSKKVFENEVNEVHTKISSDEQ